jgi:hypothetical protein
MIVDIEADIAENLLPIKLNHDVFQADNGSMIHSASPFCGFQVTQGKNRIRLSPHPFFMPVARHGHEARLK